MIPAIALALAVIGFAAMAVRAFLEWSINGNAWYAVIVIGGLALLFYALWPLRSYFKDKLKNTPPDAKEPR